MNLAPSTAGMPARARTARADEGRHTLGHSLGPWEATRLLAVGRWSRIYRVRPVNRADWNSLGDFVLKTVAPEHAADPLPRALLAREAAVAWQVRHPHLTTVLADASGSESPHLVLPYLEGASLAQVLRSVAEPMPIATACLIARQAAAALAALHDALWLHGDVTLPNIVVAPGGHATLIDLGLARRIDSEECRGDWLLAMTPGYAAPESLVPHGRLTPAADAYSLGLVLFEMLAGRPPFVAANSAELHKLHVRQAPPDLRQLRPTVSRELAELVRRLLVKEPLRRPAAGEIVRWLAEIEIAEL